MFITSYFSCFSPEANEDQQDVESTFDEVEFSFYGNGKFKYCIETFEIH